MRLLVQRTLYYANTLSFVCNFEGLFCKRCWSPAADRVREPTATGYYDDRKMYPRVSGYRVPFPDTPCRYKIVPFVSAFIQFWWTVARLIVFSYHYCCYYKWHAQLQYYYHDDYSLFFLIHHPQFIFLLPCGLFSSTPKVFLATGSRRMIYYVSCRIYLCVLEFSEREFPNVYPHWGSRIFA